MTARRIAALALATVAMGLLIQADFVRDARAQAASGEKSLSQIYRERGKADVEFQKVPPIRLFDNLWYVGPGYVSVYLIKTSEGAILIDGSEEPDMVQHVIDSIQKTGTSLTDIKAILISHGHIDHWGGVARLQELSGAPVYATEEDWQLIEQAAARPGPGGTPPRAPRRDRIVNDGDTLTVGDTTVKLYKTPGHTPGVMSAEFTVYDNGVPHKAFFAGGTGGRDGVRGFEQAVESSGRILQIDGIAVFLPNHGWNPGTDYPNGSIFERAERLKNRRAGDPHPFVDPASWRQFITAAHARNQEGLERERQRAAQSGAQPGPN